MDNKTDEELVRLVVFKNKTEAFDILCRRYEEKLLRYGRRFLYNYENIEDAVQNVFTKTYINIKSFNFSKKFSPWIYRIAHNEFINIIKKEKKEERLMAAVERECITKEEMAYKMQERKGRFSK